MDFSQVKLKLGLTSNISVDKALWITKQAEQNALNGIIIGEDLGNKQDIFTLASTLLMKTTTIKVEIGITSPLYHNLTTIGRASATLQSLTPKRFILGIGVGGLQDLAKEGIIVEKPVQALRNAVLILRDIWSGKLINHYSQHYHITDYSYRKIQDDIPIIFGVRGPKLLILASLIADGVIISGSKSYLQKTVTLLTKELQNKGRNRADFTITAWMPTIVTLDEKGLDAAKRIVATILADTSITVLTNMNIDLNSARQVKHLVASNKIDNALDLMDNEIMDEFCLYGDAREVVNKIRTLGLLGIDEVVFGPPYGHPYKEAISTLIQEWST